uniref:Uncharacterized protein n=1 Tax=Onchocerca volvulus TaxID=6282 RepID=A0A8R1XYU5_ONCVO
MNEPEKLHVVNRQMITSDRYSMIDCSYIKKYCVERKEQYI